MTMDALGRAAIAAIGTSPGVMRMRHPLERRLVRRRLPRGRDLGRRLARRRSTEAGATWSPAGPTGAWTAVASSSDGLRLLVASREGLHLSTDAGASWTRTGAAGVLGDKASAVELATWVTASSSRRARRGRSLFKRPSMASRSLLRSRRRALSTAATCVLRRARAPAGFARESSMSTSAPSGDATAVTASSGCARRRAAVSTWATSRWSTRWPGASGSRL